MVRKFERDAEGGSAFPFANDEDKQYHWIHHGMSMRDWFAGQALAGMCSRVDPISLREDHSVPDDIAKLAWAIADAMLSEANDPNKP